MLASSEGTSPQVGTLGTEVQRPATFRYELINFVADELPKWRSRRDRRTVTGETRLTSQLCAHLNSSARHAPGWDILQFRVEEPDETSAGRTVDLTAAPSGTTISIAGRSYTDFDSLFPIECKRLPTPSGARRDEREYVICGEGSTGGIQRFKAGHHGAAHEFGAMIGYIQENDTAHWSQRVASWINGLVGAEPGWSSDDLLRDYLYDGGKKLATSTSLHQRQNGLPAIELRHLWLEMN